MIVFDLDGTLADSYHRLHHIAHGLKDWTLVTDEQFAAYHADTHLDEPIEPVIDVVHAMREAGYDVVIWTGRNEIARDETERWLEDHRVPYDQLKMRKDGDQRPDHVIKEEWLDQLPAGTTISLVFEDRASMVKMFRDRGIRVCQVADGNY